MRVSVAIREGGGRQGRGPLARGRAGPRARPTRSQRCRFHSEHSLSPLGERACVRGQGEGRRKTVKALRKRHTSLLCPEKPHYPCPFPYPFPFPTRHLNPAQVAVAKDASWVRPGPRERVRERERSVGGFLTRETSPWRFNRILKTRFSAGRSKRSRCKAAPAIAECGLRNAESGYVAAHPLPPRRRGERSGLFQQPAKGQDAPRVRPVVRSSGCTVSTRRSSNG